MRKSVHYGFELVDYIKKKCQAELSNKKYHPVAWSR